MPYDVVEVPFGSALHARWSVFFDGLGLLWLYLPQRFTAADGRTYRPAFWLPQLRIWFDAVGAEEEPPVDWQAFACGAGGCARDCSGDRDDDDQDVDDHPCDDDCECGGPTCGQALRVGDVSRGGAAAETVLFDVPGEWSGTALLSRGPVPGAWYGRGAADPWDTHDEPGMRMHFDCCYQWTECPRCGRIGAEYFGRAERLGCGCLADAYEHNKTYNAASPRLLDAYALARESGLLDASTRKPLEGDYRGPVVRRAIVARHGDTAAQQRCRQACEPLAAQLERDAHPSAPRGLHSDEAATWLCAGCDGYVCARCGEQPAPDAGAPCRECEPLRLLTRTCAEQALDDLVAELGRRHKVSARAVNGRLKKVMRAPSRKAATLDQVARALTAAEHWHKVHSPGQFDLPNPTHAELQTMEGAQLRAVVNELVPPVASRVGLPIPFFQTELNRAIGVRGSRSNADDDQLRTAVPCLRLWLDKPSAFPSPAPPPDAEA